MTPPQSLPAGGEPRAGEEPRWSGLEAMEQRLLLSAAQVTQVRITDAVGAEGTAGDPGRIVFQIRRLGDLSKRSVVRYRTIVLPNNANPAMWNTDFVWTQSRAVFQKGQRNQFITINLIPSAGADPNRQFAVRLFKAKNAKITKAFGVGTIADNDVALPQLSINDVFTLEGNSGTRTVFFTVTLNRVHNQVVTVDYATQDGTAVSTPHPLQPGPEDFVATSGTLTFGVGETVKSIPVTIISDTFEAQRLFETFTMNLSNPTNATIAKGVGVGTIEDDDGKWA
jgi:hypothetical protein